MEPMFLPDVEKQSAARSVLRQSAHDAAGRDASIRRSGICLRFFRRRPSIWRGSRRRSCAARRRSAPACAN